MSEYEGRSAKIELTLSMTSTCPRYRRLARVSGVPLVDPRFDEHSFGYRPNCNRRHALATARHLTLQQGFTAWIVDDIANCFDQIPGSRLFQIVGTRLPDNIVELMERATATKGRRGVSQGAPLSPLLVNMYLDKKLDHVWRKRHADTPLLRTADDILIPAANREQAESLYLDLAQLLSSAGFQLKGTRERSVSEFSAVPGRLGWVFHSAGNRMISGWT